MKTRPDVTTKPYYKCLHCSSFRKECGGVSTRSMTLLELCEFLRDVKDFFHADPEMKISAIAHRADASEKTVERLMALNCEQDVMSENLRRIKIAVLGSAGHHSCCCHCTSKVADGSAEQLAMLREAVAYLKAENERKGKIIDKLLEA